MRLFCDANIMVETVEFLRQQGHDVISTRDAGLSVAPDDEVLALAIEQDRVLLTYNADFGDIRRFPVGTHAGIVRIFQKHEQFPHGIRQSDHGWGARLPPRGAARAPGRGRE